MNEHNNNKKKKIVSSKFRNVPCQFMFRAKNQQSPPGTETLFKTLDSRDQFVKPLFWKVRFAARAEEKKLHKNNSIMQHMLENVEKYIERKYGNITILISTLPLPCYSALRNAKNQP